MSLTDLLFLLALVWSVIYAIKYALNNHSSSLLPSYTRANAGLARRSGVFSDTTVTVHSLYLRVQTTAWNAYHDTLANKLSRRGRVLAAVLRGFYDIGTVAGMLGMLLSLGFLAWTCAGYALLLARKVIAPPGMGMPLEVGGFVKRGLEEGMGGESGESGLGAFGVTPIIPGVTVPLNHFPIILVAVFVSQIVHELGHAIAAAVDAVPVSSTGVSLIVCLPAAFVSLSTAVFDTLSPRARSRMVAAGPWHNLVFWGVLLFFGWVVGDKGWGLVGYQDVSGLGKVVVRVEADSPLYGYIPTGSLVTKLDDTSLGTKDGKKDIWTDYLTGSNREPVLGWCVGREQFGENRLNLRVEWEVNVSALRCFQALDPPGATGCPDPIPVHNAKYSKRCTSSDGCDTTSICVARKERLLTLTYLGPSGGIESTVTWSGPVNEVWEQMEVGKWMPRITLLPVWLPISFGVFWEYLKMATLSLYFLNLLPLPHLDGTKLLSSVLDMGVQEEYSGEEYDIEALEDSGRHERVRSMTRWKSRIERYIPLMVIWLCVACILAGIIHL
ncbi:peptidase family M50-domain-containing protein [Crucibulum laeve]|uniref:Endopeptidase S2P n=1 Tax=Crucibulum laeve TaxID=68775 RepID=A0A5C3LWE7_9AGAR|nr:peptidase family M50-domain-containing protein [Crucibulum laeve]